MHFRMRYIQNLENRNKKARTKALALNLMVETRGIEPLTS